MFGTDNFLPLTFYLTPPLRLPVTDVRFSMYGFTGTPSVMFDGTTSSIGGLGSGSMYSNYLPLYQARAATPSPLVIESSYTIAGDQATVVTTVTVDQALSAGTKQVQFYVALADYHAHPYLVMTTLNSQTLGVTAVGQQETIERTFTVAPGWEHENLRIVALVQNLGTEEVLQAALAAPDYKANIVIDCEPDGVDAAWTLTGPFGVLAAGNGDRSLDAFYAGEFSLQWEDVAYWTGPAPGTMVQIVAEGGQLVFTGQYSDGPLAAAVATPGAPAAATRGVSIVDWDGDGDLDLHVLNEGSADDLLRNDGGTFVAAGSGPVLDPGDGCSSAWADFNGDGNLDVYVGRNGQANLLLAGDGNGGFAPVNVYGIDNAGQARTVAWVDYDRDDILDLYVVNNGGANVLLKGHGRRGRRLLHLLEPVQRQHRSRQRARHGLGRHRLRRPPGPSTWSTATPPTC